MTSGVRTFLVAGAMPVLWLLSCAPGHGLEGQARESRTERAGSAEIVGTVRGRLHDRVRPLAGAFVEVRTATTRFVVEAAADGSYRIENLPSGPVRLRGSYPSHSAVSVTVHANASQRIAVDLELRADPVALEGLRVRAEEASRPVFPEAEAATVSGGRTDPELEVRLLEISPSLGEAGIADAVQSLPGNDPADPTDVLFMRGSTTDLKLVLLDGIPVFTPFHVAGLIRSFEPVVLDDAHLHVGGAPARYDGGLTHILDLRTRSPRRDRVRATGAVDLLSASAAAEIPVGAKAGALVSGRSLHDLAGASLGERPYGYADAILKLDADPAKGHHLQTTGFWNEESVRLDFDPGATDARWSNLALASSYEADLGTRRMRFTVGGSRYDARLPLQPSGTTGDPNPEPILASASSERGRVEGEFAWGTGGPAHRVGFSLERIHATFAARSLGSGAESGSQGRSLTAGVFGESARALSPEVSVRLGLRGDVFAGRDLRLSPRATLFWSVGPEAVLSVAAGRYHQVTRTPDNRMDETLAAFADPSGADELLPVATADHVILSLEQRLTPSVGLAVQGFWKRFEGLAAAKGGSVRSSGLDLQVLADRRVGALWLGYGLSWFWTPRDLSGTTTDFAGRHLLSAGISGALGGPLRGEARVAYGAGLPSTSVPFRAVSDEATAAPTTGDDASDPGEGSAPLPSLDESFLRIDLEVHAVFETEWGERTWRMRPYLRLLNALDRRDALFYAYQPWRPDSVKPLAELPVLPVLGIAFAF
ncbi:MAG: TonB-dependent receptor [Longimicrobiales bacterium]|nr:TonB-dependent receptor [Longimicrobiales bacterium]